MRERIETFGKVMFDEKNCLLVDFGNPEIYAKQTHLSSPTTVHILLTYKCQLNCPCCNQKRNDNKRRELTTDEWKNVIDDIASCGAFMLAIGGGEALIREDVFEITKYASNKGLVVCLTTNGVYVDKFIDKIASSGIYQLQFSLDGHTPEIHNLTHRSNFYEVVENIKKVKKHIKHIKVGVNHIVHSANVSHLSDFLDFCKRLGVDDVRLLSPKPPLPPLKKEEIESVKKAIEAHKSSLRIGVDDCLSSMVGIGKGCVAGRRICVITPYGDVQGCSHLNISYGNVLRTSLGEIWKNGFGEFRAKTLSEVNGTCLLKSPQ